MIKKTLFSISVSLVFFATIGFAQVTTGTISGVVQDQTQAVVPEASVTARHLETGVTRRIVTDAQGRYRIPQLPVGSYEVQAERTGFTTEVRQGVNLTIGREAVVDFTLGLGQVTEKVVVSGEVPLVETTTSEMGALVDDKKIRDLPLNGRSFEQLALLQPGVVIYTQAVKDLQFGAGVKFSVSGSRAYSNLFLLDGTDINDQADFTPGSAAGVVLGVETLREFNVLTNTYSAEYGRKSGGIINAITKSGTNELHGNAFYFHRNDNLDARNFFNPVPRPKPEFKRNQFGATAGGPLRRDRTFFFGGYEGLRERLGLSNVTVVPNAAAHEGCLPRGCVGVDARVKPYLDLFPLPNGRDFGDGSADFFSSPTQPTREDNFTVRGDHQFSESDSFFARYTFDDSDVSIPTKIPTFGTGLQSRYQYLTVEEKRIFSPTVLNVFRFGFNRSFSDTAAVQSIGPTPNLAFVPGQEFIGNINIDTILAVPYAAGLGASVSLPRTFAYNLFEYSDDVNYTKAAYSLKTGFNIKRNRLNVITLARNTRGAFTFRTIEDFLLAQPRLFASEAPGSDTQRAWRQTIFGFYAQSDIRAIRNLTLNLGLRYEFVTIPEEVHGKSSNLVNLTDAQVTVGPLWSRNPSLRDFAPRIGFAWDPFGNGKTSVRGGFGLFYDLPVSYFYSISGSRTYPFHVFGNVGVPPDPPPPFPNALAGIFRPGALSLQTFTEGLSTPAKAHFNLVIQREVAPQTVVTIGYVGAGGYHLLRHHEANHRLATILPDGRRFLPAAPVIRANPNFSENRRIMTDVSSSYHSLQLSANRRFSNGLQLQGSFTLSKSTDTNSGGFNVDIQGSNETFLEDPYNVKNDHSRSGFDVRRVLTFNYTYQLPWLSNGSGVAAQLLGGWQLSGITAMSSGVPFTVNTSFNNPYYPASSSRSRPSLKPGASNNPVLGGPDRYFDPSPFALPEPGFPGNLGRNTVTAAGLVNFDFSLVKIASLGENRAVQFRAEFFNIFNHPNFATPLRAVIDAQGNPIGSAGRIQETVTRERQIQFGLKFAF